MKSLEDTLFPSGYREVFVARPSAPFTKKLAEGFRDVLNELWEYELEGRAHMEALFHDLPDDYHAALALSPDLDLPACRRYYELFGLAGHFPGALP